MNTFFASLYEWWGINPLYSLDFSEHLRGYDVTCTGYIATPWYANIGLIMVGFTLFLYALLYHIIDSPRFLRVYHWWIMAAVLFGINLFVGYIIPYNSVQAGNVCSTLDINNTDYFGFAVSNALWSLIFFMIISSIPWPRHLSTNCRHTTFWKP
ncbi:MAG: hypothetical protein ACNS62_11955 [Candidatus Cyclobacteriaceae bacterium M3_2C_046]